MGFNYLQTDDRDDYFDRFNKHKRVQKYALRKGDFQTGWINRNTFLHTMKNKIVDESNFSWKELWKIPFRDLYTILENLGYEVKYEKLLESEFTEPWE